MYATVWGEEPERVKGQAVFDGWHRWRYGQDRRTRQPFFIIDASEPGIAWYTDANDCTCPDRRYRRHVCKHMVAVRLWCHALIEGRLNSRVVTASDRRELFARMAMAYDLDLAEQADTLREQYEQHLAEVAEALVEPEESVDDAVAEPLSGVGDDLEGWPEGPGGSSVGAPQEPWNDPGYPWTDVEPSGSDDGRPVWLEPGDTWGPDTLTSKPAPGQPVAVGRARRVRAPEPAPDRRDVARRARRNRGRLAPVPAGGKPTRLLARYDELFPEQD